MSYEVRVWCENGDLMGYATVEGCLFMVADADRDSGYYLFEGEPFEFMSPSQAESYAREWAQAYLEWLEETCACWDANDSESGHCGVMSDHGYSIQICA